MSRLNCLVAHEVLKLPLFFNWLKILTMKAQGVVQSRSSGAHHCAISIPQQSATVGPGHRNPAVPPVQVWGSHQQKHAMMLQPLP